MRLTCHLRQRHACASAQLGHQRTHKGFVRHARRSGVDLGASPVVEYDGGHARQPQVAGEPVGDQVLMLGEESAKARGTATCKKGGIQDIREVT